MIYQASRKYLIGQDDTSVDLAWEELEAAFRSYCEREPLGGMFLEAVLEELLDRADVQQYANIGVSHISMEVVGDS